MISKKLSFISISALYTVISILLNLEFLKGRYYFIMLGSLTISLYIWFTFKRIYSGRMDFLKILFVEIYFITTIFFLYFFPSLGISARIAYILSAGIFSYFMMLAINVYEVSQKQSENIPLLQPAKLVIFMSTILIVFVASTLIYKFNIFGESGLLNLISQIMFFIIFFVLLIASLRWFFGAEIIGENVEDLSVVSYRLSIFCIFFLLQAAIVLSFYPFEAIGRGVMLGALVYITIGYVQAYLSHKLDNKFILDSSIILITDYLFVYFL